MPLQLGIALSGIQNAQFDPDALTFISTAGITDTFQRYAINDLVVGLKLNSLWSKMDAIYPFVGGTSTSHSYNLRNTSQHNLTFNGGWTHSSTGALANGTNGYADTNYSTSSITQNDTSIGFYARVNYTPPGGGAIDMGAYNESTGNGLFLAAELTTNLPRLRMYSNACDNTGTNQQGFWVGAAGSDTRLFKNGVILTRISNSGSFPLTSGNITIGALRQLQTPGLYGYYTAQEYAFAFIGDNLTESEVLTLSSLVQRYQTALSRAIVAVPTVQDLDAQNFLVAAGITDSTQATAISNLTTGLKYYSLWSKMQAIYPFVGGTSTTHKFNLKSPLDTDAAFRLVFNGGVTQDSNGITPNGTNGYADTFYIPSTSGSQNDQHVSIYSRTNSATNVKDFGTQSAANNVLMLGIRTASPDFFCSSGVNSSGDLALGLFTVSTGLFCLSRIASGSYKIYRNGISAKTVSNASAGRSTNKLLLAANNNSGTIGEFSARNYAFASVGLGLSDTETNNLSTIVENYQIALSRNVIPNFVAIGINNTMQYSIDGITWTTVSGSTASTFWKTGAYSKSLGRFAIASSTNVGQYSNDQGQSWTSMTTAASNNWGDNTMVWSPSLELFACATVAGGSSTDAVQTSPNGIAWTARSVAGSTSNVWRGGCWSPELGIFVMVGEGTYRVITSPDGINWTSRTPASVSRWADVAWSPSLSLFVACAYGGEIMTSSDGITWVSRTAAAANAWASVAWSSSLGLFVCVAQSGSGNRAQTSPDGINWTIRTAPNQSWSSVKWNPNLNLFAAVAADGTNACIMTSPDGTTWTTRTSTTTTLISLASTY